METVKLPTAEHFARAVMPGLGHGSHFHIRSRLHNVSTTANTLALIQAEYGCVWKPKQP